jgi:hypothetical protein
MSWNSTKKGITMKLFDRLLGCLLLTVLLVGIELLVLIPDNPVVAAPVDAVRVSQPTRFRHRSLTGHLKRKKRHSKRRIQKIELSAVPVPVVLI